MAEMVYDAVQVPQFALSRSAGWEYDRPEPVPDWESVKSRPRATCPTRKNRASTHTEQIGQMIRVLLVDDHLAFRQPLAFMLLREPDITIIGQAGSVAEARPLLPEADIALIDLDLPDGEGIDLSRSCAPSTPRPSPWCSRAAPAAPPWPARWRRARPASCTSRARSARSWRRSAACMRARRCCRCARRSRCCVSSRGSGNRNAPSQATIARLTPREREVLQALAAGLSDREIAQQFLVSTETVRTHMVNLLHKLEVDSRLKALVFALKHGLATIN